jgi:hypothetical protein
MSEGFAHPSGVSRVCSPRLVADKGKLVRLCLDITLGSRDSGERKDGDNTWSLWDGTAKVDEVGSSR